MLLWFLLKVKISLVNNPLVSVIIPNYCHAQYLNQRMLSVLTQTYKNSEVIILTIVCLMKVRVRLSLRSRNNPI